MKKIVSLVLCLSIIATAFLGVFHVSAASENEITVRIDGQNVEFDVPPLLMNNRTMVPLRAIFEALGATVEWNADTRTVTSSKGNTTIVLTINSPTMYVNGAEVLLDSPACLANNRTFVPVRAISEGFGTVVDWDSNTKTVMISSPVSENDKGNTADAKDEPIWYSASMYRVGTDIPAGDYYAVVENSKRGGGYYCKYSDSTQDDIEDNGNFDSFTFFRCYDGQYLELTRCRITSIENAPVYSTSSGIYGVGTYRVGIDMPAGEYKFIATKNNYDGYYCVYNDITYDSIDNNGIFENVAYYTVKNGQYLRLDRCTAECVSETKNGNTATKPDINHDKGSNTANTDRQSSYEKVKSWLISNGVPVSSGYGTALTENGVTLGIIYGTEDELISFSFLAESNADIMLFVYEDKLPSAIINDESGLIPTVIVEYATSGVTVYPDWGPKDVTIKLLNQCYKTFDTFMELNGIDAKISDFGIDY